jgi:DinB superfamily
VNKNKQEALEHLLNSIEFVRQLGSLTENEWRTPIEEGKWTIAEIVGHFLPWDEFILEFRLPYIFSDAELTKGPDAEKTNSESASISRKETKQETIHKFISIRKEIYEQLLDVPDDCWEKKILIGKSEMYFHDYLKGLADHDRHHFEQIKNTLGY